MHTHTHSENALAQFRGEARPVSSSGLTVEGGPQRWVGVDWVCSATAHGTTDNITGLTLSPTHTHLKSSQLLHTQFNQGLCLWKWAYVTSSVSTPPLHLTLCHSICLSMYRSVFLTVCFFCFLSDCLSALRHFTFFTVRIDPPLRNDKGCGYVCQKAKAKPINS